MKVPRDLDGVTVAKRLEKLGFETVRQKGSHIVLKHGETQESITVPAHKPLKLGTLSKVISDVAEITGLPKDQIIEKIR